MNVSAEAKPGFLDRYASSKSRLSKVVLAMATAMTVVAVGLSESADAQSFNRKSNVGGIVYKTAPGRTERVTTGNALPMLSERSVQDMYEALARYEILVNRGGWPRLSPEETMAVGARSEHVHVLRRRLAAESFSQSDAVDPERFDKSLERAVRAFQVRHGLAATGLVDRQTIAVLNVPASVRLQQLRENLARAAEYSKNLTGRYVVVNIPAAQLESVDYGRVYSRHNVVVGKPARPTPVLASHVSQLNFNPYWHAPVSIVAKDILPEVRRNVGWLDKMGIRVFDGHGGPEVDPGVVDWNVVAPDRYHFRQDPGGENAMASVKINFPNEYAVYLHDTPNKSLFDEASRFFSSGCVRVDKVHILTEWLLRGQAGWDGGIIHNLAASEKPSDIKVYNPAQLRMVYLTAWALPDGSVHFRPDIYNLDGTGFVMGQPAPTGDEAAAEARVYTPPDQGTDSTPVQAAQNVQDVQSGDLRDAAAVETLWAPGTVEIFQDAVTVEALQDIETVETPQPVSAANTKRTGRE